MQIHEDEEQRGHTHTRKKLQYKIWWNSRCLTIKRYDSTLSFTLISHNHRLHTRKTEQSTSNVQVISLYLLVCMTRFLECSSYTAHTRYTHTLTQHNGECVRKKMENRMVNRFRGILIEKHVISHRFLRFYQENSNCPWKFHEKIGHYRLNNA